MRILKGFMLIQTLLSNAPGVVSPIGELSTWSSTYTKEKGEYVNAAEPNFRLVTAKNVTTPIGESLLDVETAYHTIAFIKSLYTYCSTRSRPYDVDDMRLTVQNEYPDLVTGVACGPLVDGGTLSLPEWISWNYSGSGGASIKIWLADQAFQAQFDEYEIVVIPPLTDIDVLFGTYTNIKIALEYRTTEMMFNQIQDAKAGHPETYLRSLRIDYVPPNVNQAALRADWSVLIYGQAGDNVDAISEAIVNYILSHSTHPRSQWETILPSLFRKLEFVVMPRWDKYAIEDRAIQSGIYSSMNSPKEVSIYLKNKIDFYSDAHIEDNTTVLPYPYKGLSLCIVNGVSNAESNRTIATLFPDYIPVLTSSLDFNRMADDTQEWSKMIEALLLVAETATTTSSVANGMRKTTRDGKLYISKVFNNINYLVYAKSNG